MERHRRYLEGKCGGDKDQANQNSNRCSAMYLSAAGVDHASDFIKAGETGEAVDHGTAIEQHAGGQCAENKIF